MTAFLVVVAVVMKVLGYGTLVAVTFFEKQNSCPAYCLVLAAEVVTVLVAVRVWFDQDSDRAPPGDHPADADANVRDPRPE